MRAPCRGTTPWPSEVRALPLPCAGLAFCSPPVFVAPPKACAGLVFSSPPPLVAEPLPACACRASMAL
jgi:hypothetical protein